MCVKFQSQNFNIFRLLYHQKQEQEQANLVIPLEITKGSCSCEDRNTCAIKQEHTFRCLVNKLAKPYKLLISKGQGIEMGGWMGRHL